MNRIWTWFRWILVAIFSVAALVAEEIVGLRVESLVRFVSPEYRQMEQRIEEIATELKSLPRPKRNAWGSRHGHRSADMASQSEPNWLQVDFGVRRRIDTLVLVPAHLGYRDEVVTGYGFPKHFRIELADNPEMEGAVTVVERIDADVENPGRYPLVIPISPTEGRYLRFTSLKHVANDDGSYFWALEEMMALEGNRNVAYPYDVKASNAMTLFPIWSPLRAFDGQSVLGMPVDVTVESPSKGYLSASLPLDTANELSVEKKWKWCGVDLGQPYRIEQVQIIPVESEDYQVFGGRAFPRGFRVELAMDQDFQQVAWQHETMDIVLGYPSGWAINLQVPGVEARYVRFIATGMWARDDKHIFGLAELQVYGDGQNLALGKRVFVKDRADLPTSSGWAPEYLVDGYTSRYRLIKWAEYLELLEERAGLEHKMEGLLHQREAKLLAAKRAVFMLSVLLVVVILAAVIWILVRQRYLQRRAVQHLREQIARDLHDDIGSNLGGIVLLSEVGSDVSTDEESKHDFRTIHEAADQASSSMRDIVWLVQPEKVGLKEMIMRMREVADMLLGQTDLEFAVQPLTYKDHNLSLLFRRHVFLAFKEVLNNVRKHANATKVEVMIEIEANRLRFQVQDDGRGFDTEEELLSGYGLGNLRRRASRAKGSVDIQSASGQGTTVTFEAPFTT